jgi:stage II sporulation protein E
MMRKNYAVYNLQGFLSSRIDSQTVRIVLNASVSFLTGLLASRAAVFGGLAPFGIAAVTAAQKADSIFVLLGAILGYMLPYGPEYAARYIAATIAVFILKWIFSGFEALKRSPVFAPAIASVIAGLTGIAVVIANGATPNDLALCFAETIICGCSVIFFEKAMPLLRHSSKLWGLDRHELVSVIITYCILLLALSRITIMDISVGRVIGIISVLVAARYGGEAGGSITGAALGLFLGLGNRDMATMLAGYGFGGLMAGVFSPLGRFGCTIAFILANGVISINSSASPEMIRGLYEVLAATLIFMVLPEKFLCRFSAIFVPARESMRSKNVKSSIPARLRAASDALQDVSQTVSKVGSKLSNLKGDDISTVYSNASEITCKLCGMHMYCWGTAYNDTMDALSNLTETLINNCKLEREDVPAHFAARCCRLSNLLSSINRCYAEYTVRGRENKKTEQLRGLLIDEFGGLAEFLKELSNEFINAVRVNLSSNAIREAFSSCGLNVTETACFLDEKGRMTIEADILKKGKTAINKAELAQSLTSVCGRELDGPFVSGTGSILTLSFSQKPAFSAMFGQAAISKKGEKLCGDAADSFIDDSGRAVLMLSDGMGCGGRAAVDSNMAVRLMSRLMHSGFGYESALRIVNAAMLLKSGDETFATLDIAAIDLYSGETEFLKAGAAPTYIRRCGRVERISQSSMPVGILRNIKLERSTARMRSGDIIVMVSDGVITDDDNWLIKVVENYNGCPPDEFAEKIAQEARSSRDDGHDDDITVIVGVID